MGQFLLPHNLETFEEEEDYDLDRINANTKKINDATPVIVQKNSSKKTPTWDFTGSVFTRISVGSTGIVMASLTAQLLEGKTVSFSSDSAEPANPAGIDMFPEDMRPASNVGWQSGPILSGNSQSPSGLRYDLLIGFIGAGTNNTLDLRRHPNSGDLTVRGGSGTYVKWNVSYAWNGVGG